ncbi:hypothetical protein ACJJTC_010321 [Scirpophaga incertulas]
MHGTMDNFQVVDYNSLNDIVQNLIKDAVEVRNRAYCPYSNFPVGAAILTEDHKVFAGCNIENAAFSPSICAERAAVCKAVSEGHRKFSTVAIVAHQKGFTAPCGVCRQTLHEFCGSDGDVTIYLTKPTLDKVLYTKLSQLLPLAYISFTEDNITT